MGTLCMNMSNYEIERGEEIESSYGEEILYDDRIPGLAFYQQRTEKVAIPAELAMVDIDAFLCKMYAYRC